jgi:6-pyruvoyltetrahydropterin/6-carboxytetrahydropterin synthase
MLAEEAEMFELTVEMPFSAAHRLPEHPGRCARLHGHSYRALITVAGERLDAQGMVVDFGDLKELCGRVIAPLDHTYLNELPAFAEAAPTAEAIAQHIHRGVSAQLEGAVRLARVTVYESETSFAAYWE